MKERMKKALRIGIWLLGLVTLVGLLYVAIQPQPVLVDVRIVGRGPLQVTINEDGLTRIRERYIVSTPLAGRLERVSLEVGDEVREGKTIIAQMQAHDPSLLDPRAVAQAKARVRAAERRLDVARAEKKKAESAENFAKLVLNRVEQLQDTNVLSQSDMDAKEMEYRISHEETQAANFQVDIAEYELELQQAALLLTDPDAESKSPGDNDMELSLKAPIHGRILRIYQESSAVLEAGEPIMEIGDPQDLEIVVDVLSEDAVRIRPGNKVELVNWGGEEKLDGRVRIVEPSGFTKLSALGVEEQRVNVVVDLLASREERLSLGDGFRVDARIVVWEGDDILSVPTSSLFRQDRNWVLFRVTAQGTAELTHVTIGENNGIDAQVLEGVQEGDAIVVHPSDDVLDGVAVQQRE